MPVGSAMIVPGPADHAPGRVTQLVHVHLSHLGHHTQLTKEKGDCIQARVHALARVRRTVSWTAESV